MSELGILELRTYKICTNCSLPLSDETIVECSHCRAAIDDWLALPEQSFFERSRGRSRDVGWLVAIHGMATTGQWQQELQWLIDLTYKQTVPFDNWKYGRVRFDPLVGILQRRLVARFNGRLHSRSRQSCAAGLGDRPDVIAHSFGTWLLGHALHADPTLRVGRVILVGSILRPDFDWQLLFDREQVEGVLNHYGRKDKWSKVAVRAVPDAGPSGAIGFLSGDARVYNLAADVGHSSFFDEGELSATFNDVWKRFLRDRLEDLPGADLHASCAAWSRPSFLLRAPALTWLGVTLIMCALFALIYGIIITV